MKRLALLLALCFLAAACDRGAEPRFINQAAPDFTVQDPERRVALSQFRGKVVVLNFWATWCPPCIEELPSLMQMQRTMGDQVVVLAVSVDQDEAAYKKFLRDYNVQLLTVRDPDQQSARLYGTTGFPETFIIDRSGVVQRKIVGPVDWMSPEMLAFLRQLSGATTTARAAGAASSR